MRRLGMGIFEFRWLAWRTWFFLHLFYHRYIARVNEEDLVAVDRPHTGNMDKTTHRYRAQSNRLSFQGHQEARSHLHPFRLQRACDTPQTS